MHCIKVDFTREGTNDYGHKVDDDGTRHTYTDESYAGADKC